jgi:hypothetical protein
MYLQDKNVAENGFLYSFVRDEMVWWYHRQSEKYYVICNGLSMVKLAAWDGQ